MKYGRLPVRVLTGIIFIVHGIPKLVNISGTQHFFSHALGFPPEMAVIIVLLEVIGGFTLLFGILTRISAISPILLRLACQSLSWLML